jgi:uncharacterized membrane protein
VGKNVLGEFSDFTLNYEENYVGGIEIGCFLKIWVVFHVDLVRRGVNSVLFVGI